MKKVHLDFETRSRVDIKKCGAGRYCTDPSTKILCLAYAIDDGPIKHWCATGKPPIFDTLITQGYTFVAHNALFEYMIWKYVWREEPPNFMCTMSKACAHGLPWQLEKLSLALKLRETKDIEGKRLIRFFSIPNKDGKFNAPIDYLEDFRKFIEYCKQDVNVERHIDDLLPDLTDFEQEVFQLTLKINDRGLKIDEPLANAAVSLALDLSTKCNEEIKKITDNKIHSITQTVRLKNFINETYNVDMPGVSSEDIENQLTKPCPKELKKILELRSEFGRSSVAKFSRAIESCCDDGRIRNYLIYHGASTGRWTSQTVQFQNLPRGQRIDQKTCIDLIKADSPELFNYLYDKPMSALSTCIRGLIVADQEKELLVADYASIEARVLMWLVGQRDAIRLFREGQDIYVEMAKVIYRNKNLTKKNKDQRQLGKQAVLGCGYQMGSDRFKVTCANYGLDIDLDLAERAVTSYRTTYGQVPKFWNYVEDAARYAIQHKRSIKCGRVSFFLDGRFLYCQLPSGRSLAYYYPGLEEKEMPWGGKKKSIYYFTMHSETKSFKKTHTYGGKLTENIVQAIARDIMASAMLRLEKQGVPVILSVHDEIICEVKKGRPHSLKNMLATMCLLPVWAKDCPISAEGWKGYRYRK